MKKVLTIAAGLVLILGGLVLWLSREPSQEPSDTASVNNTTGDKAQNRLLEADSGEVESTEPPRTVTAPLATPPETSPEPTDSGFRPITQLSSDADQATSGVATPGQGAASQSEAFKPDGLAPSAAGQSSATESATEMTGTPPAPSATPQTPVVDKIEPLALTQPNEQATAVERSRIETTQPTPQSVVPPPAPQRTARSSSRQRPPAPTGRYETITTATARDRPSDSARIVQQIRRGTFLNVTGSEGDWLKVYSRRKDITVYVRRDEAMLSRNQRSASKDVPERDWPTVERAIQQAFQRNNVIGVQASFIADTAYLKGTVKTERERERAEIFARSVLEVKHVFNGIRVE